MNRILLAGVASLALAVAPFTLPSPALAADPVGVVINEVESNGGTPGDWVELHNPGSAPVDISGWVFKDNDDTHAYAIPAGTTVAPGAYYLLDEAQFGFGLGGADTARLFDSSGAAVDAYAWTTHAAATYGRVPDGTGAFASTSSTRGASNTPATTPTPTPTATPTPSPSMPTVVINETVSTAGTPGDWIELKNTGTAPVDVSGWVVKDNDDTHAYTLPAGTTIAPGAHLVVEEAAMNYGLGGADSVRVFTPSGTLVDSWTWTAHAPTSWARCADGTGTFTQSAAPTKGAANNCAAASPSPSPQPTPAPAADPWPGAPGIAPADVPEAFTGDLSGLDFVDPTTLWAVTNGTGSLTRLTWNGTTWVPSGAPLALHYPDGTGTPDAEGVTVASDGLVYVGTERNNAVKGTSSLQVLRIDPGVGGTATRAWDLTAKLPVVGANTGIEAIEFVPDSALSGFVDPATGHAYDPAAIPAHGGGLFFVGIEETGAVHAFALHEDGTSTLVASLSTTMSGVMALDWNADTQRLWAVCDDGCQGLTAVFDLTRAGEPTLIQRPLGMPNLNNEGFALSPVCADGRRMAVWADGGDTDSRSLRVGHLTCAPEAAPTPNPTVVPTGPQPSVSASPTFTAKPTPTATPTGGPVIDKDSSGGLADTGAPEGSALGLAALVGGLALLRRR